MAVSNSLTKARFWWRNLTLRWEKKRERCNREGRHSPPLWGDPEKGYRDSGVCGSSLSLTLPQRKSGLPDLRKIKHNRG